MTESSFSLHPHESLRLGLLRVVDALIDSVSINLDHQPADGKVDIHEVRTTIKRLRALLRLIRPTVDPAFFNRENRRLRTAAGLLSFARDAEVARVTLKGLPVSDQADHDAVRSVLAGFEDRAEAPTDIGHVVAEVRRYLEQTRRNLHRLTLHGSEREILKSGLRAVYRQGRRRMRLAIEQGQDHAFHRWRIRAKNLYYELEFLELIWPKRFHRLVSHLVKLQDQIGFDHDAAVLRAWLKKTPEKFGGSEKVERIVRHLDSRIRELRKQAVPLGRKIWRQKPRRFARQIVRCWPKHKQV